MDVMIKKDIRRVCRKGKKHLLYQMEQLCWVHTAAEGCPMGPSCHRDGEEQIILDKFLPPCSDEVQCRCPTQAEGFVQETPVILLSSFFFTLREVKGSPIPRILLWGGAKQSSGNLIAEMESLHFPFPSVTISTFP